MKVRRKKLWNIIASGMVVAALCVSMAGCASEGKENAGDGANVIDQTEDKDQKDGADQQEDGKGEEPGENGGSDQKEPAGITNTQPTVGVVTTVESGQIRGYNYNGTYTFKGIPYAKAERFKLPEKPDPWEGVRSCLVYGAISPQNAAYGKSPDSSRFTEYAASDNLENEADCMNLNVWTQTMDSSAGKPVVVFFHGGGYSSGAANELATYDGNNISKKGDMVFVTVTHRLNVLGFLDLSEYSEEYKYSGNCGTADMVAALQWVHDNIATFGGDPSNVTIVGQSGGGGKVTTLMGIPAAEGLFQKVWAMSGSGAGTPQEKAWENTRALVESLGLTKENAVETLVNMPYDDLNQAYKASNGPVVDGDYFPEPVFDLDAGTFTEAAKDIPLVVSTVYSEMSGSLQKLLFERQDAETTEDLYSGDIDAAMQEKYGEHLQEVMDEFAKAYPDKDQVELYYINKGRSNALAQTKANQGGAPVYQAVFAWELPVFGGTMSWHTGGDIPFLFYNADKEGYLIAGNEVGAYAYQEVCASALINYAYTGNPSPDGMEWPAFTTEEGATMIFDTNTEVRNYHDQKLLELVNEYAVEPAPMGGIGDFIK